MVLTKTIGDEGTEQIQSQSLLNQVNGSDDITKIRHELDLIVSQSLLNQVNGSDEAHMFDQGATKKSRNPF